MASTALGESIGGVGEEDEAPVAAPVGEPARA
jgi:hypothetical protein